MGDEDGAAARYREIHDDLREKGRTEEALAALREAVRLNPYDNDGRGILARAAVDAGDLEAARELPRSRDGGLRSRTAHGARRDRAASRRNLDARASLAARAAGARRGLAARPLIDLGWSLTGTHPEAAFACVDAAVDDYIAQGQFDEAGADPAGVRRPRAPARAGAAEA